MRSCIRTAWLTVVLMFVTVATALANYPGTLDGGNLVLVDGGMGVGYYADRSSVQVEQYAPPKYQLAVNLVSVQFSDEYWRKHETYIGGPYTKGDSFTLRRSFPTSGERPGWIGMSTAITAMQRVIP